MKILITLFILLFSSPVLTDDISDFQIEGMSIGDSLLDYISKKNIIQEIEINKPSYNYLREEYGEIYLFNGLSRYYSVIFFVKLNDQDYIIQGIRGTIDYDDKKMDDCYTKQEEVINEILPLFKVSKKEKIIEYYKIDPSGKSKTTYISLKLKSGDVVSVDCNKWEEKFKLKNNFMNSLVVSLQSKEVNDWLSSKRIY